MKSKPAKKRLDLLLVERGIAESVAKAQAMILAGEVRTDGEPAEKAGMSVKEDVRVDVTSRAQKYVSRAGFKLEGALGDFSIDPAGRVCLDVGCSTGGFTDCLLQRGASFVYAVDVNVAQMAWKLQRDSRVVRIERNARALCRKDLPELVDLAVADVSFISVGKVLRPVSALVKPGLDLLILVKPQFELPKENVRAGGIVRDPALHEKAVAAVHGFAVAAGLEVLGTRPSHLFGAEGNLEYFLHARKKTLG